jgi:hypothetical protein
MQRIMIRIRERLMMAVRNQASYAILPAMAIFGLALIAATPAKADSGDFLSGIKKHQLLTSTSPDNGDQNPYALVVAPVSAGSLQKNDVLVDNFNNSGNLQGTGTTIVDYRPSTGQMTTFAALPAGLPGCPGGVGLSTAMIVLKSGWVIVGSAPSTDGTVKTLGKGCLIVLDSQGKVAGTITGPEINDPWGNMAVIDHGDTAKIFLSNVGFDIGNSGATTVHNRANVLRLDLRIPAGKPPVVTANTVIADGLSSQADPGVFLIGPTGLALGRDGQLYVSDAINNRVVSIPDAATRNNSAGTGREITQGGFLNRPLALTTAPNGNLLVINGLDGYVVEVDPVDGKQLGKKLIDGDQAQSPPGSGDLFGIAVNPDGKSFYYVEDDINALMQAK